MITWFKNLFNRPSAVSIRDQKIIEELRNTPDDVRDATASEILNNIHLSDPWQVGPEILQYYRNILKIAGIQTDTEIATYRLVGQYLLFCNRTAHLVGFDLAMVKPMRSNSVTVSAIRMDEMILNVIWETLQWTNLGPLWNVANDLSLRPDAMSLGLGTKDTYRDAIYDLLRSDLYRELENTFAPECRRTK